MNTFSMSNFNFQVGSGGNDSLGSGHHSPNGSEMVRSESALELRGGRKTSLPALSASQMQKSVFRKSMPMHLEVIWRIFMKILFLKILIKFHGN